MIAREPTAKTGMPSFDPVQDIPYYGPPWRLMLIIFSEYPVPVFFVKRPIFFLHLEPVIEKHQ